MVYQYGSPSGSPPRPLCWGQENRFNPNDRDCRVCSVQNSCSEQVTRIQNSRQQYQTSQQAAMQQAAMQQISQHPTYQQTVFNPNQSTQTSMVPVSQPYPSMTPRAFVPAPVPVPTHAQSMQRVSPHPVPKGYGYGWMSDPLATQIVSMPPPVRPQFEGETPAARFAKNVGLAMAETFLVQCLLSVRQLVLPPRGDEEE